MASLQFSNVKLSALAACVPADIERNADLPYDAEVTSKIISTIGVEQKRIAKPGVCASDLCYAAANKLIQDNSIDPSSIDLLIFNSQTADYILPTTSGILQYKLGLKTSAICFDMSMGCSGYVYSLYVAASIIQSSKLHRALVLVGDTISHKVSKDDRSTRPLFGDAGSATLLEYSDDELTFWDLNTDGSGSDAIMIYAGGSRNPTTPESFLQVDYGSGILRNETELSLNGMDVFNFSISSVPRSINDFFDRIQIDREQIAYYVLHQANLMMNNLIAKKIKISLDQMPLSLSEFGNTSSASIPVTIATKVKDNLFEGKTKLFLCGFGVGLSYASAIIDFKATKISELTIYE